MSTVTKLGRLAVSHYTVREALGAASLVEVRIETGRTHQIRVHMAHLHHPVVGDRQYGRRTPDCEAQRQMLHAKRLAFAHPRDGGPVEYRAPLPGDMQAMLASLRAGS